MGEICFAVTALGVVGAHNRNNVIAVLAGVDDLTDFRVRASRFHIEPVGISLG